jgi:hypothetical protein
LHTSEQKAKPEMPSVKSMVKKQPKKALKQEIDQIFDDDYDDSPMGQVNEVVTIKQQKPSNVQPMLFY